jgi:hypothetical protein
MAAAEVPRLVLQYIAGGRSGRPCSRVGCWAVGLHVPHDGSLVVCVCHAEPWPDKKRTGYAVSAVATGGLAQAGTHFHMDVGEDGGYTCLSTVRGRRRSAA